MSFVFLSHRGTDKPRIRPFVQMLVDRKVPVWIDRPEDLNVDSSEPIISRSVLTRGIQAGSDYPLAIDEALFSAFAIVVFWSANWQADRAMLTREFSVAHARQRAKLALYFPVFLDASDTIPNTVMELREQVHDTVQGYNVARHGATEWNRLADDISDAWLSNVPTVDGSQKSGVSPALPDWSAIVRGQDREPEVIVSLLKALPPGPAVEPWTIPFPLRMLVANSVVQAEAAGTVAQASAMVLATFPSKMQKNRHALVVMPAMVPSPIAVASLTYWDSVFDNACVLGPRMVAAVLLAIRPLALVGQEQTLEKILHRLGGSDE